MYIRTQRALAVGVSECSDPSSSEFCLWLWFPSVMIDFSKYSKIKFEISLHDVYSNPGRAGLMLHLFSNLLSTSKAPFPHVDGTPSPSRLGQYGIVYLSTGESVSRQIYSVNISNIGLVCPAVGLDVSYWQDGTGTCEIYKIWLE